MKALTIYQPHASLVAVGAKKFETRGWATNYRGPIAIHAGLRSYVAVLRELIRSDDDYALRDFAFAYKETGLGPMEDLPRGAVIAIAELIACREIREGFSGMGVGFLDAKGWNRIEEEELLFGDWRPGRYAWELADVQMLPQPVPCRGRQGLWNWEEAAQNE